MTGTLPAPQAILFDWDGTLIDNWDAILAAINEALAAFSKPIWSRDEAMERISASQRDSFPILFGDEWERAQQIFYAGFEKHHLAVMQVLDGAEGLLQAGAGLPMGLVSNKNGGYLRKEVAHLGWQPRFRSVVGATDAQADKPDPAPVRMALEPIGLDAGPHVWFVGDSSTDMATARAAGCTAVLVRHAAANPSPIPANLAPDLAVESLNDLTVALADYL
jgi:phosphoglycolate phosphatase